MLVHTLTCFSFEMVLHPSPIAGSSTWLEDTFLYICKYYVCLEVPSIELAETASQTITKIMTEAWDSAFNINITSGLLFHLVTKHFEFS